MSGIIGSITKASKEINNLSTDDTIKGIRLASSIEKKIKTAIYEKEQQKNNEQKETSLDEKNIVEGIKKDMESSNER